MPEDKELLMSFDPRTIQHLGIRMYSTLPPVVAELIANAYDADASFVNINLVDDKDRKFVIVSDDGVGMTFSEINSKFLRIGRDRRREEDEETTASGRKVIGKKGIGKLSFFGIADEILITTCKEGKMNRFNLSWESIKSSSGGKYNPKIVEKDRKCPKDQKGTEIVLDIKRRSDFDPGALALSLSKIFIFDKDFRAAVQHNGGEQIVVDNKLRFSELDQQFTWKLPFGKKAVEIDYDYWNVIKGSIITTRKPIPPNSNLRGITLFSRNKLVNLPEYFSSSASSHFFSYLTGWLEVDFIDDLDEDVISTNRQSLNWDHPDTRELKEYLAGVINFVSREWREKRAEQRTEEAQEKIGINLRKWYGTVGDLKDDVKSVVDLITSESELSEEKQNAVIKKIHDDFVPEYPYYHWRHLHKSVRDIARDDYINGRYFDAAEKASRLYIQKSKDKAGVDSGSDSTDMDTIYNPGSGILMVTKCNDVTERNIQNGQQQFSKGVVVGCRNPLTHNPEYLEKLVKTKLFTEKDCLDLLSLISHLFYRLDSANKRHSS